MMINVKKVGFILTFPHNVPFNEEKKIQKKNNFKLNIQLKFFCEMARKTQTNCK